MNPLLQSHFDTALEHPNGIKKLRELILTLAMQGKLVSQDPNDQLACELLKEIQAEKARLVAEGKIKKSDALAAVKNEEKPFVIPKGWEWVRLGEICEKIHYGYTASADFALSEFRLLRITDIQDNKVNWESVPGCSITSKEADQYLLDNGDILIARTGGTIGKTYLVENIDLKAVFASYLIRAVPSRKLNIRFLKISLETPLYWVQLYAKSSGTGQPNVNGVSLSNLVLPLPPLAEQKRIVDKIDEFFLLCDELETLKKSKDTKRKDLHQSIITQMLEADSRESFQKHFQFLTTHFHELYSVKENVKELRKAVLQLAVMGKLVPQDSNDQPASELLKEIQSEKARLVAEGKVKKSESLPAVKDEEKPFAIPKGWEWVRLGEVIRVSSGENLTKEKMLLGEFPVFGGNGITGYHNKFNTKESTIVIGRVGFYCGSVHFTPEKAWITDNAFFTHFDKQLFDTKFLIHLLKATNLQSDTSATAQPVISGSKIYPIVIAIPPLAEQKRIVEKVDELLVLCDELEEKIGKAEEKRGEILDGMVRV